jgi:glyceraldehyde 3-phosphate dehydrogenase
MSVKVGINGFGRIGRNLLRASLNDPGVEIVAVNDITDPKTLAHLLKYDSVFGAINATVGFSENAITVNGKPIRVFKVKDPAEIDWSSLGIQVVVESTGLFTKAEDAKKHLKGTVKKVVISAPAKGEDITIVLGVNENMYDAAKHHVLSNASCTTNCLAPAAKVINDSFKILKGSMTTIHAYTNDQKILDLPHKDLRRARAAALSMIPTTTGAAKAVGLVLPELKGKLDGYAMRVPTPDVSVVDLVALVEKPTTTEEVNAALKKAAEGPMKGILQFVEEELVSKDFTGNDHSSMIDAGFTKVIDGTLVKVVAWYDNEWGYSCRVRDLINFVAKKGL